jgi:YD repeat-containing protein
LSNSFTYNGKNQLVLLFNDQWRLMTLPYDAAGRVEKVEPRNTNKKDLIS